MKVQSTTLAEGTLEIKALGTLDEASVDELRTQLLDRENGERERVLLNLSLLDEIDSSGVALVLLARIEIEARGGAFAVHARAPRVRSALRAAGIGRFVTIADDRATALAALDGSA